MGSALADSWYNRDVFKPYPELLVLLTIATGFLIGRIHYKTIAVGSVTGCLIMGLVLGQSKVEITGPLKSFFFILFLFALGYKVGPQFFRGLKKDGLPQVYLSLIVCVSGLAVTWIIAKAVGYGPGLSAGLLAGGLTQSAVIGVSQQAIGTLPHYTPQQVTEQQNLVPVAYSVGYVIATVLAAIFVATVLPKFLKQDLAVESQKLAKEMAVPSDNPDLGTGYYEVVQRTFKVENPAFAGRTIQQFEDAARDAGRRLYITNVVRGGGGQLEHDDKYQNHVLLVGDTVALSGLRDSVVGYDPERMIGTETNDVPLLDYETEHLHVIVNKDGEAIGRSVADIRREPEMAGVFIDKMYRAGFPFPYRLSTQLDRGDTLVLTGPKRLTRGAADIVGKAVPTSYATDMMYVAAGVFLGGLIGIPALKVGGVPVALSTSGGALIMGLVFGWFRSKYPTYGNVPPGAQWFMDTFGLCAFVAIVGINAAPSFVDGLKKAGAGIVLWSALVCLIPLIIGFVVGHYGMRMRTPLLMASLAGAETTTAAFGAVNEAAKSSLPTLGYTVPYAVSNVLLTIWGSVIVLLNH
ncbi:putative transport protein [Catenulispora sp. EB89]|uniref:aspartate:alanine exchanger family transporter n=1 Tax=Catenulispora sp. EB89 TaxID=3156257 RepID=UPI0035150EEE